MLRISVITLVCLVSLVTSSCTEEEHREMQNQFSACRTNYNNQFHDSGGGDSSLCTLLDQVVNVCTLKWSQCHSDNEIINMKSMHAESFIQHWSSQTNIENCPTAIQLRSRVSHVVPDENVVVCDDEESSAAMNNFQTCSHSTSSTIYTTVLDLDDIIKIIESLCAGLQNISSECPGLLATCFAPDDVKQMKTLHLQEMKKFYYTLVQDRIPKNALESCDEVLELSSSSTATASTTTTTASSTTTTTPTPASTTLSGAEESTVLTEPEVTEADETNDIQIFENELEEEEEESFKDAMTPKDEDQLPEELGAQTKSESVQKLRVTKSTGSNGIKPIPSLLLIILTVKLM